MRLTLVAFLSLVFWALWSDGMRNVAVVAHLQAESRDGFQLFSDVVANYALTGEVTVATELEVRKAFATLNSSQSIIFKTKEVHLTETLVVASPNVSIVGALEGTTLYCPSEGHALLVKNSDVRIVGFRFTGCHGKHSAVIVTAALRGDPTLSVKEPGEENSSLNRSSGRIILKGLENAGTIGYQNVVIENCLFDDNHVEGSAAAMATEGAQVTISSSSFTHNSATINGGAVGFRQSNVSLKDVKFRENSVEKLGGAVYQDGGVLALSNGQFSKSVARFGGHFYAKKGNVSLAHVILEESSTLQSGGGINLYGCMSTIQKTSLVKSAAEVDGGALRVYEGECVIQDSTLLMNSAKKRGGAILADRGSIQILDSVFDANSADLGAGVYTKRTRTSIAFSNFHENAAHDKGGAVYFDASTTEIRNCSFDKNEAKTDGGAVRTVKRSCEIRGCHFTNNTVNERGGAVSAIDGSLTLLASVFDTNKAQYGGAFYAHDEAVSVVDCRFHASSTTDLGGAVSFYLCNSTIANSSFIDNFSKDEGGAVRIAQGTCEIQNSRFVNNAVNERGGAVYAKGGSLNVSGSVFHTNKAQYGGAVYARDEVVSVNDCHFHASSTTDLGGAVSFYLCNSTITSSSFIDNFSKDEGGAVRIAQGTCEIQGCHFANNTVNGKGGAVYYLRAGAVFRNSSLRYNTAKDGGAFYAKKQSLLIESCHFYENSATADGGAVSLYYCTSALTNSSFIENSSRDTGGAIHVLSGDCDLEACKFSDNTVDNWGGAFFATMAHVKVRKDVFKQNHAKQGGAIYTESRDISIDFSEFYSNVASAKGGAIILNSSDTSISSTSFLNNLSEDKGGAVYLNYGKCDLQNCTLKGNLAKSVGGAVDSIHCTTSVRFSQLAENVAELGGALHTTYGMIAITHCQFTNNTSHGDGGALKLEHCETETVSKITNSRISDSKAGTNGGALSLVFCSLTIAFSDIHRNEAMLGGGISLDTSDVLMHNSSLVENWAKDGGGAIRIYKTSLEARDLTFLRNNASRHGGAMYIGEESFVQHSNVSLSANVAYCGGGVFLSSRATITSTNTSVATKFSDNVAEYRGGGIYCHLCKRMSFDGELVIERNIAVDSGGGMFISEVASMCRLTSANIARNVANKGGGIAILDSRKLVLGSGVGETTVNIMHNAALIGGGLFLQSEHASKERYEINRCNFTGNRALELRDARSEELEETVVRWWNLTQTRLFHELAKKECVCCSDGKGGGLYLALKNARYDATVSLHLANLTIEHNAATCGGGTFIKYRSDEWEYMSSVDCAKKSGPKACRYSRFTGVAMRENKARRAGGGLFLHSPISIAKICGTNNSLPVPDTSQDSLPADCISFRSNEVLDRQYGYGKNIATTEFALHLSNMRPTETISDLQPGDKLKPRQTEMNSEGHDCDGVELSVLDLMNQTVKRRVGNEYSDLVVVVDSLEISGQREYMATAGMVCVENTTVTGIAVSGVVRFRIDDNREVATTINFTTRPCMGGQLADEKMTKCIRCNSSEYTFAKSTGHCLQCEKHAICTGTTVLVPEDGYWHSTPFSPFLRRCLIENACSWENRKRNLTKYYETVDVESRLQIANSSAVNEEMSSAQYVQCADGYEGWLCGSCSQGFGHSFDGRCLPCRLKRTTCIYLTTIIAVLLFGILTFKLTNEVDATRIDVLEEIKKQRRIISISSATMDQEPMDNPENIQSIDSFESAFLDPTSTADRRIEAGPSHISSLGESDRRVLLRATHITDPELVLDPSDLDTSPELHAASQMANETFKILFNYIQFNSVALSLGLSWRFGLRFILTGQALLGRLTSVFQMFPFECNLADRDRDVGIPNVIRSMWYRTFFPVLALFAYLVLVLLLRFIRPKPHRASEADIIPPITLVALIVFVSYIIDVFGNFVRVLNCVDMSKTYSADHPYHMFERVAYGEVWVEDTRVHCWEGSHLAATVVSSVGIAFCVLVIVYVAFVLYKGSRRKMLSRPQFLRRYGFLYGSYRKEGLALYWEIVLTIERLLLATVSVYVQYAESTNATVGLLFTITFASTALHLVVQPYEDIESSLATFPIYGADVLRICGGRIFIEAWLKFNRNVNLNWLMCSALFMSLSIYGTGMAISDSTASDLAANILLLAAAILNSGFILFLLYRLWYAWHHYFDVLAVIKETSFTDAYQPKLFLWTKIRILYFPKGSVRGMGRYVCSCFSNLFKFLLCQKVRSRTSGLNTRQTSEYLSEELVG